MALCLLHMSMTRPFVAVRQPLVVLARLRDRLPQPRRARSATETYPSAMRVLLTGMSGVGKSTLVQELRRRGYAAYDADDDGFSEPREDGRWGWRADAVASLLAEIPDGDLLFFAGCSEEQIEMPFDCRVLLTVPEDVMVRRLTTRTSNAYGRTRAEQEQVLSDLAQIEPLLRRSADLVLSTTAPVAQLADRLLAHVACRGRGGGVS